MSKCEICGSNFENFHAQGFDNKIYCSLCYFKKLAGDYQQRIDKAIEYIKELDDETDNGIYEIDSGRREELLSILKGEE